MQALIPIHAIKSSHKLEQFIVQNICKVKIYTEAVAVNVKENIEQRSLKGRLTSALTAYREVFI